MTGIFIYLKIDHYAIKIYTEKNMAISPAYATADVVLPLGRQRKIADHHYHNGDRPHLQRS